MKNWAIAGLVVLAIGLLVGGVCAVKTFGADTPAAPSGPAAPAEDAKTEANDAVVKEMFKTVKETLKREGSLREKVMTITIPRDDLEVSYEDVEVPSAAGIESDFRFFQCPCGEKLVVIGQFVTADYEANDVVDALRAGHMVVSSVGPFLAYEKPRLSLIRFQGEGKADEIAKALKATLEWTGKERLAPAIIEK